MRRHAFFASSRPLVFAHRGGSALAPENTIAAFDNGLALGADGLELDVHLSRDGVVVVHHDRLLDRTTALRGPVAERTAEELAARRRADARRRAGALPRSRAIIVELKVNTAALAAATVAVVRRPARSTGSASDRSACACCARRGRSTPAIATSAAREEVRWALYRSWCRWPVSRVAYGGYQIPERAGRTRVVSPRFVEYAHDAGLGVQVWTVDTAEDARRLLGWGVDALITDRPDLIVPVVAQCNGV